jgi:hypothetical protein
MKESFQTTLAIISAITAFLLAGCVSPYAPYGPFGGYSDTELAPDFYRIVFHGNNHTTRERTEDMTLLRASELTLKEGFAYFAILQQQNGDEGLVLNQPGYAQTFARGTGMSQGVANFGSYGATYSGTSSAQAQATTTFMPPSQLFISYPVTCIMVKAFRTKPNNINTFDAAFLVRTLKPKYGIR